MAWNCQQQLCTGTRPCFVDAISKILELCKCVASEKSWIAFADGCFNLQHFLILWSLGCSRCAVKQLGWRLDLLHQQQRSFSLGQKAWTDASHENLWTEWVHRSPVNWRKTFNYFSMAYNSCILVADSSFCFQVWIRTVDHPWTGLGLQQLWLFASFQHVIAAVVRSDFSNS